jgi:hypothetical protein
MRLNFFLNYEKMGGLVISKILVPIDGSKVSQKAAKKIRG